MVTQRHIQATKADPEDLLTRSKLPTFFAVNQPEMLPLALPAKGPGQHVRVWARSLSGMQKECIVASALGTVWRLASDEGPYLDGFDAAPCPLAFMTVGMVSSYMNSLLAVANARELKIHDLALVQDNRYRMEGSALQGTMTGDALPVGLEIQIGIDVEEDVVVDLVQTAVRVSPVERLLRERHPSQFSLTVDGREVPVGRVATLDICPPPDPQPAFSKFALPVTTGVPISRLAAVTPVTGVAGGAHTSLQSEQRRTLHVRAVCRRRHDGVKEIEQQLHSPLGSTFQFLSDEVPEQGGLGAAPDAASYMAAGVAFCFMTQLGRYAAIVKRELPQYGVVQDTCYSHGNASSAEDTSGTTGAVQTHVYLDTPEGAEFARDCVDMGEQTCFLHALYRSPLEPMISITRV